MTTNPAMWQTFEAEWGKLADEITALAEERKDRNEHRNARRRISRTSHLPKRQRSRVGSNLPKRIGPKRARELRTTLQYELLKRIFARQDEIDRRGIEATLHEMLLEYPPRYRRSERAAVEFISKDIIRQWLLQFTARERRPAGERTGSFWNEIEVCADLNALRRLAKSALRALPKKPQSRAEWRALDRANAEFGVLNYFLETGGLGTREEFMRACDEIGPNPVDLKICVSQPYYQASWRDAIYRLKADLTRRYVDDGDVCSSVPEGVPLVADLVKPDAVAPAVPPKTPSAPPPEEHLSASPAQEYVLLDLDSVTHKPWEDYVIVFGDDYEKELIGQYKPLSLDMDKCLYDVRSCDDPKILGAAVKVAITALNSMMEVTAALDDHRRGTNEEIVLSLDGKAAKVEPISPALIEADRFLDDFLLSYVSNLERYADHCREKAKYLEVLSETEPSGAAPNRRGGPDRRGWNVEFRELASFMTGEMARFKRAIKTRHTRARREILLRVDLGTTTKPVRK